MVVNTTEVPEGTKVSFNGTYGNMTNFSNRDVRWQHNFTEEERKFIENSLFYMNQLRKDCDRLEM